MALWRTRWSVNAYNFFGPAESVPKWAAHVKSTCFLFLNWSQVSENKLSDALTNSLCVFLPNNIFFSSKKRSNFAHLAVLLCWDSSKTATKILLADTHPHWSTCYQLNFAFYHPRPKQFNFVFVVWCISRNICWFVCWIVLRDDSFFRLRLSRHQSCFKIKHRKLLPSTSSQHWFCKKFDFKAYPSHAKTNANSQQTLNHSRTFILESWRRWFLFPAMIIKLHPEQNKTFFRSEKFYFIVWFTLTELWWKCEITHKFYVIQLIRSISNI